MKGGADGANSKMEPWRRLRSCLGRHGGGWGADVVGGESGRSHSTSWGVVPRTAPSLRVERMSLVRWRESSVLKVGGGAHAFIFMTVVWGR